MTVHDHADPARESACAASRTMATDLTTHINAARTERGLRELRVDKRLTAAATEHARDMAARGYFSHDSPEGETAGGRTRRHGYTAFGAENIAWGHTTPADTLQGWMDSPGHRRNVLNPDLVAIGAGHATTSDGKDLWAALFGRPEKKKDTR